MIMLLINWNCELNKVCFYRFYFVWIVCLEMDKYIVKLNYKFLECVFIFFWLIFIYGLFGNVDNLVGIKCYFEFNYNVISIDLFDYGEFLWIFLFFVDDVVNGVFDIM